MLPLSQRKVTTPGLRTVNHFFDAGTRKCAWFRDTEGDCLCLHQTVQ